VSLANLSHLPDEVIELSATDGVGWITALKAPQIKKLVATGALQLSLFDERNLAEIEAPEDYPGKRLVVCRNPLVAQERARKREELLAATERGLQEIDARVRRGTVSGQDQIGLAVGPALKRYRVKKHFEVEISDTSFTFARKTAQIAAEATLDGFYVLRTSVPAQALQTAEVVRAYKGLEQVERAFDTFKDHREPRLPRRQRAHQLDLIGRKPGHLLHEEGQQLVPFARFQQRLQPMNHLRRREPHLLPNLLQALGGLRLTPVSLQTLEEENGPLPQPLIPEDHHPVAL
jgi:hypothetical protein